MVPIRLVNHLLDSRFERECASIRKSSTITFCDQIFNHNIQNDAIFIPTPENTINVASSVRNEIPKAKEATKKTFYKNLLESSGTQKLKTMTN